MWQTGDDFSGLRDGTCFDTDFIRAVSGDNGNSVLFNADKVVVLCTGLGNGKRPFLYALLTGQGDFFQNLTVRESASAFVGNIKNGTQLLLSVLFVYLDPLRSRICKHGIRP